MSISSRTAAVIGAGPVGLEIAYRLQQRQISYFHFDRGCLGNTLLDLSPATVIGTAPQIQIADRPLPEPGTYHRDDYLAYLRTVARERGLSVQTFEHVCGIHRLGSTWQLRTAGYNQVCHQYRVQHLIFATGNRNFPRTRPFPGADSPLVHSRSRHPHHYFQRTILIVGAGPEAQAAARQCADIAKRVYLCSAEAELQATPTQPDLRESVIELIQRNRISYLPSYRVERLDGTQVVLRGERVHRRTLDIDFLLTQSGYEPDYSLLSKLGVSLKGPHMAPVHDPETMETNVASTYVAGALALGTVPDDRAISLGRKHAQRIAAAVTEHLAGREPVPPTSRWLPVPDRSSRWLPQTTPAGVRPPVGP